MTAYEYKVVPAPKRGLKAKGVKSTEDRFAHALEEVMNPLGAAGWDYVRTDTLPCEERVGLTGRRTEYQNMLVFRRPIAAATTAPAHVTVPPIVAPIPAANAVEAPAPIPAPPRAEPTLVKPASEGSPEAPRPSGGQTVAAE